MKGVEQRLATNRFVTDVEAHLEVDAGLDPALGRVLVAICPARVFVQEVSGRVTADAAACLECGACAVLVTQGYRWQYPRGGMGIAYSEG